MTHRWKWRYKFEVNPEFEKRIGRKNWNTMMRQAEEQLAHLTQYIEGFLAIHDGEAAEK